MLRDWNKLAINVIRNDRDLWRDFQNDYQTYTGRKLTTCKKCLMDKHYELLRAINFTTEKNQQIKNQKKMSDYILKQKFNGILFDNKVYQNGKFTNAEAAYLLKTHPMGVELFSEVPKNMGKEKAKEAEVLEPEVLEPEAKKPTKTNTKEVD